MLRTHQARRIKALQESFDAMIFTGRSILFVALGCGLTLVPGIHAQQAGDPKLQARPASGQDQEPDPLKRERSDEDKFKVVGVTRDVCIW